MAARLPATPARGTAPPAGGGGALLALLALCSSGACKTHDWAMHNVRETHQLDGSVRRVGKPYSPVEYALTRALRGVNFTFISEDSGGAEVAAIEDPLDVSLDALLVLADREPRNARGAGLAVEACTWLAVDDPYVLARERAVLGLGRAALRLGLTDGPRALPPDAAAAGPAEVAAAISGLLRAARAERRIELAGAAPEQEAEAVPEVPGGELRPAMAEACAAGAALVLDREGARRLLGVVNALLALGLPRADEALLEGLSLDLQRRCAEQTLFAAAADPSGLVRAAALRAAVEAAENRLPARIRSALLDPDWRVALEALHLVQRFGLPREPGERSAEDEAAERERWLSDLALLTIHRDSRVGTAACQALSQHAAAGFESLRPEDWTAWSRRRAETGR